VNAEVAEKRISMWVGFANYKYRLLEYIGLAQDSGE